MISVCVAPRQKEFDVDAARNRALDRFRRRGYEATPVNDLVAESDREGSPPGAVRQLGNRYVEQTPEHAKLAAWRPTPRSNWHRPMMMSCAWSNTAETPSRPD